MGVEIRSCASVEEVRQAITPIGYYFGRSAPAENQAERLICTLPAERVYAAWEGECPEQKVLLETDPAKARAIGRRALELYLTLPNYRNNFLRMGFTEQDMENGGSNRLVDGLVAWGDEHQIRARIQEHWDAGADQVCIQSVPREGDALARQDERIFELLAPKNS